MSAGPVAASRSRVRAWDVGTAERLLDRWPAMRPFVLAGAACVVTGGLVAAVTRPLDFDLGSWLAAFLVLVGGVAQLALGAGQAWLSEDRPAAPRLALQVILWNGGLAATIAGSLAALPILTSAGGAATALSLVLFLCSTRSSPARARWPLRTYQAILFVVLASIPVGVVLAWVRHA